MSHIEGNCDVDLKKPLCLIFRYIDLTVVEKNV